jgi:hypothetical protein
MALMLRPSSFALRPSPFDKLRVRKLRVRKLGVRKLRVRKLGVRKLGTRKGSYQFALTLPRATRFTHFLRGSSRVVWL